MSRMVLCLATLAGLSVSSAALADGDAGRGTLVYRACVACHALEPGLHLSGLSLDGFIGRMAGTAEELVRYSTGLKKAGFFWNAADAAAIFEAGIGRDRFSVVFRSLADLNHLVTERCQARRT